MTITDEQALKLELVMVQEAAELVGRCYRERGKITTLKNGTRLRSLRDRRPMRWPTITDAGQC